MPILDKFSNGLTWDTVLSIILFVLTVSSYIALRIIRKKREKDLPSREERDRIAYENAAEYRAEWEKARNIEEEQ